MANFLTDQNSTAQGKPLRILRLPEVLKKVGFRSKSSIYALERDHEKTGFPLRVALCESKRASGWYEHEIDQYLASLPRLKSNEFKHSEVGHE
jgi:predicted DNA-binding transcriptional regulator AlpA